MQRRISVFDTTLRDGEQMPGVNMSIGEKLRIAYNLERLGVDIIEAGFPAASQNDARAVEKISENVTGSTVAALARADKADIDAAVAAISKAKSGLLHIFIATSDIHLKYKLGKTREELLQTVREAVTYGKSLYPNVQFSAEDASRSDPDFLIKVFKTAVECGAGSVCIPDTVGYSVPDEFGALVKRCVAALGEVPVSVHCHNDLGLAVANTLAAVANGASRFDCTVNGIGERAGNASLEETVMAIKTRADFYGFCTGIDTSMLSKVSKTVASVTGVYIPPNKAIVGANAFSHESGIHQHGVLNEPSTYEIIDPRSVGIKSGTIVLGKLSGHHAFEEKLAELDIKQPQNITEAAYKAFKDLACRKSRIDDDDIRALIEEAIIDSHIIDGYELESYQTQSGDSIKAMAMITVSRQGKAFTEAATGEGPIDACFNALNRIVGRDYKLINYGIKAVTGGTDALGEVRVRIADGENEYVGKGVSTDIIKSSIKSYINAINRAMCKEIINGG
ncbi:MAG: 2-isopropylmalate synthase [Clostridia bacterium]|nr:2-isopropylmalate synthase [Clostridia bacterium]